MMTDPDDLVQNQENQQAEAFAQRYLQSPLLISWARLAAYLQAVQLADQKKQ